MPVFFFVAVYLFSTNSRSAIFFKWSAWLPGYGSLETCIICLHHTPLRKKRFNIYTYIAPEKFHFPIGSRIVVFRLPTIDNRGELAESSHDFFAFLWHYLSKIDDLLQIHHWLVIWSNFPENDHKGSSWLWYVFPPLTGYYCKGVRCASQNLGNLLQIVQNERICQIPPRLAKTLPSISATWIFTLKWI